MSTHPDIDDDDVEPKDLCFRNHGAPQGIEIDYGIGGNLAYLKGAPATIGHPKMTMNCRRHHIPFILICKKKEGQRQPNDGAWI